MRVDSGVVDRKVEGHFGGGINDKLGDLAALVLLFFTMLTNTLVEVRVAICGDHPHLFGGIPLGPLLLGNDWRTWKRALTWGSAEMMLYGISMPTRSWSMRRKVMVTLLEWFWCWASWEKCPAWRGGYF